MSAELFNPDSVVLENALTLESLGDIPGNTTLQHCITEVTDQPDVQLDTLTDTERSKLFFRFISTVHHPSYRRQIAEAAGQADYYITEGVTSAPSSFRPVMDVCINMALCDRNVPFRLPFPPHAEGIQPDSILYGQLGVRAFTGTLLPASRRAIKRFAPESPVIRTMDMSDQDIIPGTSMTLEEASTIADDTRASVDLASGTNEHLLTLMDAQVLSAGTTISARNDRQYQDISTISANAVRRHPKKDRIVIAVLNGAAHGVVAERILGHSDLDGEQKRVPAAEDPNEVAPLSIQNQAYDELVRNGTLSQETRQRVLLYDYAVTASRAFDDFPTCLRVGRAAENSALTLSDSQVSAVLDRIEDGKRVRFSLTRRFAPEYFVQHLANIVFSEIATSIK